MNHPVPPRLAPALLLALLTLAGCGKVQEATSEKATEKMAEAAINQNGGDAKVDIHQGGVKVEGTDEKGQSFKMEMGAAQIGEKDLGIPFYPGAKPVPNHSNRFANGDQEMLQVELTSSDAPQKVADWYRSQLKAHTEGKMVMDQSEDQGMSLTINDPKSESTVIVEVKAADSGSSISLTHGRKAPAKG